MACEAEVSNLQDDVPKFRLRVFDPLNHNVFQLEVTVCDSLTMHVGQSKDNLVAEACHLALRQRHLAPDTFVQEVKECAVTDELHYHIVASLIFEQL